MRAAVVVVWRPKHFPFWGGHSSKEAEMVPRALASDRLGAPYTGIHLASLLPRTWNITLVHEMVRNVDLTMDVDVVFLSTMDFCASRTRRLAMTFRARGAKVIVGGLYPTMNPRYFVDVSDAVIVGEAEPVITELIADLQHNTLRPVYRASVPADLSDLPVPRYDLVETDFRVTMVYEATRGCPFQCGFCVLSALRAPYRRRPIKHVIRDLQAIPSGWNWIQRKYFGFYDNNLGADRAYFKELCEALTPLKRIWGVETSIDTVTPETARFMGKAGARFVYIGLETLSQASLTGVNKRHNKVSEYRRRIGYLHDNGIIVMSIFLLGLDEDSADYLQELPNLLIDIGVDVPVFTFAVPIEGTPFHKALEMEGRLAHGDILDRLDGVHLLYQPKYMSSEELETAVFQCMRRAYTVPRIAARIFRRLHNHPKVTLSLFGTNLFYRGHQRAIADCGMSRLESQRPEHHNEALSSLQI